MSEIENEFSRLRGRPTRLSPLDWQLVADWESAGIPLSLILRVMTEVYKRFAESNPRGQIGSIRYFQPAIAAAAADWRSRQIGKSNDAPAPAEIDIDDIRATIKDLLRDAEICVDRTSINWTRLDQILTELRTLSEMENLDAEFAERELRDLDDRLVSYLTDIADSDAQDAFNAAGTSADKYLRSAQIAAAVRKHFNAPELTLFSE